MIDSMKTLLVALACMGVCSCGGAAGVPSIVGDRRDPLGSESAQYGFESGVQGWTKSGARVTSLATTTSNVWLGNQALQVNLGTSTTTATQSVMRATTAQLAGKTITFNVFIPVGAKLTSVQVYAQENASTSWRWNARWLPAGSLSFGSWNAIALDVPANAAPLQGLGIQFVFNGAWSGALIVDSIGWPEGVDGGAPVVDAGGPVIDAGAPVVDAGGPVVDAGGPVVDAGGPVVDAGAPVVDAGGPVVDAGGPVVDAGTKVTVKVMPFGDSITEGANGGYRNGLWTSLVADGCSIDYVGSRFDQYALVPDKDHQGTPGLTIYSAGLEADADLDANNPDYVLLLIGTNDIAWWAAASGAQIADQHDALVAQMLLRKPSVWVLVSSIPPITPGTIAPYGVDRAQLGRDLNAAMKLKVEARVAAGHRVKWVDVYSALTTADLQDGVHPTPAAYSKVAAAWHQVLSPMLACQP
jgi:lysophospholipase L1-like esterase